MYRPKMYDKHNYSLNKFADLFNSCSAFSNLRLNPIQIETFDNDGVIIDLDTNVEIGFDWEYRDQYFSHGIFTFDSLGQFERKIVKKSIDLSIQCDSTETAILVAWHSDWMKENHVIRSLSTDSADQMGKVRYTKNFRIYDYKNIIEFKDMINRAMKSKRFDASVFKCL